MAKKSEHTPNGRSSKAVELHDLDKLLGFSGGEAGPEVATGETKSSAPMESAAWGVEAEALYDEGIQLINLASDYRKAGYRDGVKEVVTTLNKLADNADDGLPGMQSAKFELMAEWSSRAEQDNSIDLNDKKCYDEENKSGKISKEGEEVSELIPSSTNDQERLEGALDLGGNVVSTEELFDEDAMRALFEEDRAQKEMNAYLESRPMLDDENRLRRPVGDQHVSKEDAAKYYSDPEGHYERTLAEQAEQQAEYLENLKAMSMGGIAKLSAFFEFSGDKTSKKEVDKILKAKRRELVEAAIESSPSEDSREFDKIRSKQIKARIDSIREKELRRLRGETEEESDVDSSDSSTELVRDGELVDDVESDDGPDGLGPAYLEDTGSEGESSEEEQSSEEEELNEEEQLSAINNEIEERCSAEARDLKRKTDRLNKALEKRARTILRPGRKINKEIKEYQEERAMALLKYTSARSRAEAEIFSELGIEAIDVDNVDELRSFYARHNLDTKFNAQFNESQSEAFDNAENERNVMPEADGKWWKKPVKWYRRRSSMQKTALKVGATAGVAAAAVALTPVSLAAGAGAAVWRSGRMLSGSLVRKAFKGLRNEVQRHTNTEDLPPPTESGRVDPPVEGSSFDFVSRYHDGVVEDVHSKRKTNRNWMIGTTVATIALSSVWEVLDGGGVALPEDNGGSGLGENADTDSGENGSDETEPRAPEIEETEPIEVPDPEDRELPEPLDLPPAENSTPEILNDHKYEISPGDGPTHTIQKILQAEGVEASPQQIFEIYKDTESSWGEFDGQMYREFDEWRFSSPGEIVIPEELHSKVLELGGRTAGA